MEQKITNFWKHYWSHQSCLQWQQLGILSCLRPSTLIAPDNFQHVFANIATNIASKNVVNFLSRFPGKIFQLDDL